VAVGSTTGRQHQPNEDLTLFFGYYAGSEDYYTHKNGGYLDFRDNTSVATGYNKKYSTNLFWQQAIDVIDNHAESGDTKPLFLLLAFQAPHTPHQAPSKYIKKYKNTIKNTNRRKFAAKVTAMDDAIEKVIEALQAQDMYDNTLIIFISDNGGEVEKAGNNYPLRGGKHTMFEGGNRVIAFLQGSNVLGQQNNGSVFGGLMHMVDWIPTLHTGLLGGKEAKLEETRKGLSGGGRVCSAPLAQPYSPTQSCQTFLDDVPPLRPMDGVNMWKAITKQTTNMPRTSVLYNIDPVTNDDWWGGYAAIRVGDYKLLVGNPGTPSGWCQPKKATKTTGEVEEGDIVNVDPLVSTTCSHSDKVPANPHNGFMLFNLAEDPYEKTDLSTTMPDKVNELYKELQKYNTTMWVPLNATPQEREKDPKSNPKNFNNVWTPWL